MRYLFGLLCVCALIGTLPLSVSAQAGEQVEASEPDVVEAVPTSEPAPEEPALQLKLDDAGVEVTPSPSRTEDGYTLEEMELRVKRAKIGLGASAGVLAVGVALTGAGASADDLSPGLSLVAAGGATIAGGLVGIIVTAILLDNRKRDRDSLKEARYGTPRRVQWDLARSRLVF